MKIFTLAFFASLCIFTAHGEEREISIPNGKINLAGTLSLPQGKARAVAVMATGSGPQNRDEEIAGHKPFKLISDSLASHGIAVLRLDDRGTASSTGDFSTATLEDLTSDIAAGLEYARKFFPDIPKGVIGHSQGGSIAIKLGAGNKCDYIVTLAAPAWAGDSLIMSQSRALATALTGRWDAEPLQRKLMDIAKGPSPDFQAQMMLYTTMAQAYGDAAKTSQVQDYITKQTAALVSPGYRSMLRSNPEDDIRNISIPWLALNGSKDMQVLPSNLETIKKLNGNATTKELPGLNHLFQNCTTGLPDEYEKIAEDFSPSAITEIIDWFNIILP